MIYLVDELEFDNLDSECKASIEKISEKDVIEFLKYHQPVSAIHKKSTAEVLSRLLNRYIGCNNYYVQARPGDVIFICKCISESQTSWRKVEVESNLFDYQGGVYSEEIYNTLENIAKDLVKTFSGNYKIKQDYFKKLFFEVHGSGFYALLTDE